MKIIFVSVSVFLFLVLLATPYHEASAGKAYKCINKDGSIRFSDNSCDASSKIEAAHIVVNSGMDSSDIRARMDEQEDAKLMDSDGSGRTANVTVMGSSKSNDRQKLIDDASTPYAGSPNGQLTASQLTALSSLQNKSEATSSSDGSQGDDTGKKASTECASSKRAWAFYENDKTVTPEEKIKASNDFKRSCGSYPQPTHIRHDLGQDGASEGNHSAAPAIQQQPNPDTLLNCDPDGCWGTGGIRYTDIGNGNYINSQTGKIVRPQHQ